MDLTIPEVGDGKLPDFFLVGTAKGGTTSLYHYLCTHPQLFMPDTKEPWFFSSSTPALAHQAQLPHYYVPYMITSLPDYLRLYRGASAHQLAGDASPSYLYTYQRTIPNIQHLYAEKQRWRALKFIIVLRNPVDRAWSMYWTLRRSLEEDLEFEAAVQPEALDMRIAKNCFFDYVGVGSYASQVQAYFEAFGRQQVKVILFEDLQRDTLGVCQDIFAFLGVDATVCPQIADRIYNPSGQARSKLLLRLFVNRNPAKLAFQRMFPRAFKEWLKYILASKAFKKVSMLPETRARLGEVFRADIIQTQELIERDLSRWLR